MKRLIMLLFCAILAVSGMAQNNMRTISGIVLDIEDNPIYGAVVEVVENSTSVMTGADGRFKVAVPLDSRTIEVSASGYFSQQQSIGAPFFVFNLKIDKNYAKNKAKAEEEARLAAEKAAEEEAKAKAEEEARIAAEKEAKTKAKAAEEARIAAQKEAAAKAKAEEQARIAAQKQAEAERLAAEKEATAKAKAEEQARIAAQKQAEAERLAAEKELQKQIKEQEAIQIRNLYAQHQKGYRSYVELAYTCGQLGCLSEQDLVGVHYIGGYQFNNQIFLGVGAGVKVAYDWDETFVTKLDQDVTLARNYSIPVFAHFRANFLNRRCSPFFALSAGVHYSPKHMLDVELGSLPYTMFGALVNPQIGINYRVTQKVGTYLSLGYELYTGPYLKSSNGYNAVIQNGFDYSTFSIHLGVTF